MSKTEKTTLRLVIYIDIKSGDLRDALRIVLKDIQWVSLSGDKPAVCTLIHVSFENIQVDTRPRSSKAFYSTSFPSLKRIEPVRQSSQGPIVKVSQLLIF